MSDIEKLRRQKAYMLLKLVKEHKKVCRNKDCGISVFYFLEIFEQLKGKKATKSEFRNFI